MNRIITGRAISALALALVLCTTGCGIKEAIMPSEVETEPSYAESLEAEKEDAGDTAFDKEADIIMTEGKTDLQVLVNMLTLDSYLLSGDTYMYGYHYPVNDVSAGINFLRMLLTFTYFDSSYEKYAPTCTLKDEKQLMWYCGEADVKLYFKNVFGIDDADLSAYSEDGMVPFSLGGNPLLAESSISALNSSAGGTYKISGIFKLWVATDMLEAAFPYELAFVKNDASPFGYQVVSMDYQEALENDFLDTSGSNALSDIFLHPEANGAYYPNGLDYANLCFALIDIDNDGEDEILMGSARDAQPLQVVTIFNILKYDRDTGAVADFDGDRIYEPLNTSVDAWKYYDTGILMTMADAGMAYTKFWNLRTGELIEGWLGSDDEHSKVRQSDGSEITGTEGDMLYKSLKSGQETTVVWYAADEENLKVLAADGDAD